MPACARRPATTLSTSATVSTAMALPWPADGCGCPMSYSLKPMSCWNMQSWASRLRGSNGGARHRCSATIWMLRCIICVSEQSKAHLVEQWRVSATKVVVFPNAVDVALFGLTRKHGRPSTTLHVDDAPLISLSATFINGTMLLPCWMPLPNC